jgi:Zn-dependent M28 family amino/carboxypeptidase
VNRFALSCAVAALAVSPASAQTYPAFDANRLRTHVKTLSDDSFQGRAPATPGETMTVDYLSRQFGAAGLQPGGDLVNGKRQWTQAVPLLKSDFTAAPRVAVQTTKGPRQLTQGEQIAVRSPLNGQSAVALSDAPLLFVGYGVHAPERGWDDFKGQDVRGKILVVLINDPDFEELGEFKDADFGGKAMTYYGRWTYKFEEAAKRGAAGVMIVHEDAPASYGWATVKNSNTNSMFDIVRQNPTAEHSGFESWISLDTARRLFADAGLDYHVVKATARRKSFQPVDLKARLTANLAAKTEVINAYNVAAMLPGKTRPDETILYTAHHDHLGVGQPDANGDRIYNGAVDNATGIAHLIEQARAFAKRPRTDRTIVFLAVGAEEKGLLGAEYYVSKPLYPLSKTVAVLNTDSMGPYGKARNFGMAGTAKLGLLDMIVAEGKRQGRSFSGDPRPEAGSFYRSDHFAFAKAGVPAISWRSGTDLANGGNARGMAIASDYTAKRYHQPDDEYSSDWDFSGIVQDAQLLHAVGRRLANSNEWPNWSADSEFRGLRDQSAGERAGAPSAEPVSGGERG